jgi:sugar O-acyltransferase (sialic acid O-acetyltransferase NeuD family)
VRPLVLVGAGGFARETAEAVRAVNASRPTWDPLGFVDDDPALHGTLVDGLPVLGPVDHVAGLAEARVVVCTGSPGNYASRKRLVRRLERLGVAPERYATVVHPAAVLATGARVGRGSVVLATTVATASLHVGSHVAVMPGVILTHDDEIGDYATLAAGVRLAGGVQVGEGAYVGAGALVRERLTVGAWSLVGMGAVVLGDIPPGEVWAGVPARRLRAAGVPPDVLDGAPGVARDWTAAGGAGRG